MIIAMITKCIVSLKLFLANVTGVHQIASTVVRREVSFEFLPSLVQFFTVATQNTANYVYRTVIRCIYFIWVWDIILHNVITEMLGQMLSCFVFLNVFRTNGTGVSVHIMLVDMHLAVIQSDNLFFAILTQVWRFVVVVLVNDLMEEQLLFGEKPNGIRLFDYRRNHRAQLD